MHYSLEYMFEMATSVCAPENCPPEDRSEIDRLSPIQGALFVDAEPSVDETFARTERIQLSRRSWVDVAPGWLRGSETVLAALLTGVQWQTHERPMYERWVTEPRLHAWFDEGQPWPHPVLASARLALEARYGEDLPALSCNLYRHERDSVAWHGDRVGRLRRECTVAIISVGRHRPFLLRPKGGGRSRSFLLGDGDLIVMGGACQREFEHSVPKVRAVMGPRISVMLRSSFAGQLSRSRSTSNVDNR